VGVCRGPGLVDPAIAGELVQGNEWEIAPEAFEPKTRKALRFLRGEGTPPVWPNGDVDYSTWVLGSSDGTAKLAGEGGAGFAASLFIARNEEPVARSIGAYRAALGASAGRAVVAVSVVGAATADAAERREEKLRREGFLPSNVVGDFDDCRRKLASIAARCGADELLIVSFSRNPAERAGLYANLMTSR
jgi:alkanesulfonate monooxygenase SsuD/methylene tetrahydromethanopterin reductase-like flavin-dependent oxidoreductase (luciferase family)